MLICTACAVIISFIQLFVDLRYEIVPAVFSPKQKLFIFIFSTQSMFYSHSKFKSNHLAELSEQQLKKRSNAACCYVASSEDDQTVQVCFKLS